VSLHRALHSIRCSSFSSRSSTCTLSLRPFGIQQRLADGMSFAFINCKTATQRATRKRKRRNPYATARVSRSYCSLPPLRQMTTADNL
jgi:hypothetical protein